MVHDILEVFKKEYEKKGDELILGSYNLKDGLYVKINEDETTKCFESKTIKKEKVFTNSNGETDSIMEDWFKQRDYYSSYINSNKALFDKKIHNINYLSYFFKLENSDYAKDKIDEHFQVLSNFSKFKDTKDKEILQKYNDILKDEKRKEDIFHKHDVLKSKFDEIILIAQDRNIKNYVKIFFDADYETYKKESEIYYSLKIFNDSKYNKKIENNIYGLSNSNMGLNSKKPFLENKTRKLSTPFMIKNEDALMLKKFFDWLKVQPYRNKENEFIDRHLDEHFFLQKQSNNDEAEVVDFDYIPIREDDVDERFKPIYVKNYLFIKKDGQLIEDYEIKNLQQLEKEVDKFFYNNQLIFNYYRDNKDIKITDFLSKRLQTILFVTKNSMLNYFRKFSEFEFIQSMKKYSNELVINFLIEKNGSDFRAKLAMNLKLSLKEHYDIKGEKMDVKQMLQATRDILNDEQHESISRNEFLFLAGQFASFLLSLNRADNKNKTLSLAEQYFRAKNINKLHETLREDIKRYKHAINLNNKKIGKATAVLLAYESDEKLTNQDQDYFLIGFMTNNIFYESNKQINNEEGMKE